MVASHSPKISATTLRPQRTRHRFFSHPPNRCAHRSAKISQTRAPPFSTSLHATQFPLRSTAHHWRFSPNRPAHLARKRSAQPTISTTLCRFLSHSTAAQPPFFPNRFTTIRHFSPTIKPLQQNQVRKQSEILSVREKRSNFVAI